jgi:hypothetical protein
MVDALVPIALNCTDKFREGQSMWTGRERKKCVTDNENYFRLRPNFDRIICGNTTLPPPQGGSGLTDFSVM